MDVNVSTNSSYNFDTTTDYNLYTGILDKINEMKYGDYFELNRFDRPSFSNEFAENGGLYYFELKKMDDVEYQYSIKGGLPRGSENKRIDWEFIIVIDHYNKIKSVTKVR